MILRSRLTAVALLTLLAFLLRAYHLDHFSFWIDEALTPLRTSHHWLDIIAGRTFIQEAISQDTHPPLYYLLVAVTRQLWGSSDYAFRYFSLLWGVLLVPLLFQLGRELFNRRVGLVAALLVAINPLHIWYSQEARMYTLLVWLGALSTYLLVRGLKAKGEPKQVWRWLGLYLLAAGLMLYTHYTAVFLIALHALFWAWQLWRIGYHKLIFAGFALGILALIPLLPLTLPRLFTGAESGYSYLPPWIILRDVIGGFSMGVTAPETLAPYLWWGYLALLGWGAWVTWRQKEGRLILLLLLGYLLATAIGLAVGSLLKPMYQGVRHIMLGSPALLILLAVGLVAPAQWSWRPTRVVVAAGWLVVLLGSIGGVWSLYTNPAVAKDDLRQLVAYLEAESLPGDLILYNDMLLLLAHWHYAQRDDVMATAVPVYPYPADDSTPVYLQDLTRDQRRVWFVPPLPTDGRDPSGMVRGWVRENLHLVESRNFSAKSTELKVETYRVGDTAVDNLPPTATLVDPIGTTPALQATNIISQTDSHLWFNLFWQGEEPTPAERLIFTLTAPDGWTWVQESRPLWLFAEPWPTSGYSQTTYRLPLPLGLPAGEYQLAVRGWDEVRQLALGGVQPLAPITIAPTVRADGSRLRQGVWAGDGLTLAEVVPYDTAVKPGNTLPVRLLWVKERADSPAWQYRVQLVAPDGTVIWEREGRPGGQALAEAPAGAWVAEFLALPVAADTAVGEYALRWQVLQQEEVVGTRPWWQPAFMAEDWTTLGQINVEPWPLLTADDVPPPSQSHTAQFGDFATLRGYDFAQTSGQLNLTLQWEVRQPAPVNYLIFVHLVDPVTGQPIRQRDWFPADGLRPARGWRSGEIILDPHTLDMQGVPPGVYELNIGFYEGETFARPAVMQDGELLPHNQLRLQQVVVE
jgi:mannosyltransferase